MKAGIGSAALTLPNGLVVAALVAVNAVGDIIDPATGTVVAGVRGQDGRLADARALLRSGQTLARPPAGENTTIGVVATNARLTKAQANRMALMADDGYARAIYPSHTEGDGDTIFALATGRWDGDGEHHLDRRAGRRSHGAGHRSSRHSGDRASRHPSSEGSEEQVIWELGITELGIRDSAFLIHNS